MKVFIRVLIVIVVMPILLSMTACSTKKVSTYSSKDLISLQDIEKLLKDNGIELESEGSSEGKNDILQKKHCTMYSINNDKEKELYIYVFSSEKERKLGQSMLKKQLCIVWFIKRYMKSKM